MQQLVGTRNEDTRYDFLLFIGRVLTSCLPDLYPHNTLSRYRLLRLYFSCLFNAVHTIRTCKSFQTNDFQDRSLTTRTHGRTKVISIFLKLGTVRLFHCFSNQEELKGCLRLLTRVLRRFVRFFLRHILQCQRRV